MFRSSKVAEWRSFRIVDQATYQATLQRLSGKERSDVYILWKNCDQVAVSGFSRKKKKKSHVCFFLMSRFSQFNLKLRFGEYLELKTRHARSESGVEIWTRSKRVKMTDHKLEKIRELMLTSNEKKFVVRTHLLLAVFVFSFCFVKKAAQHSSSVDLADHHVRASHRLLYWC